MVVKTYWLYYVSGAHKDFILNSLSLYWTFTRIHTSSHYFHFKYVKSEAWQLRKQVTQVMEPGFNPGLQTSETASQPLCCVSPLSDPLSRFVVPLGICILEMKK